MKKLHEQVIIVPVIAKSDSLTVEERKTMKTKIRNQLEENQIFVYYFPDCQEGLAMDTSEYNSDTKFSADLSLQPFNVIGSNYIMDGRLRARKYKKWGKFLAIFHKNCNCFLDIFYSLFAPLGNCRHRKRRTF